MAYQLEVATKAKAGYVEYPGGPKCGNCKYLEGSMCAKFGFTVSKKDGCCNYWESADGRGKDYQAELEKEGVGIPNPGGPLAKYLEEED